MLGLYCCMHHVEDNARPHHLRLGGLPCFLSAAEISVSLLLVCKLNRLKLDFMLSVHAEGMHNHAE